jgi:hypothetical protein
MGIKEHATRSDGSVSSIVPVGGIPVNMLRDFLPTMHGKDFDLLIKHVEMDEPMIQGDSNTLIDQARSFRYGLNSGQYKPSVQPKIEEQ